MKTLKSSLPALLIATTLGSFLIETAVQAGPPDRYREPLRDRHFDRGHPPLFHRGSIVRELPFGYRPLEIRGVRYYECGGVYFTTSPGGYIVVDPPGPGVIVTPAIGSLAVTLPIGAVNVTVGGSVFYRAGDVFYRHAGTGYVVVERPPGVVMVQTAPPQVAMPEPPPVAVSTEPVSIWVGSQEYLTSNGAYYRRTPEGLKPVEAPISALLPQLPAGSSTLWIDGNEYSYFNSVFYRKTPTGYMIVGPPQNAYVKALPKNAQTVFTGGRKYFHVNGGFYEARDQGYLITGAPLVLTPNPLPVGTVYAAPPDGSVEVWVNETEYLYFAGTFYRKQPTGYMVVDNPM